MKKILISFLICASLGQAHAFSVKEGVANAAKAIRDQLPAARAVPVAAPAESIIEIGFSPEGSAEELILKLIRSARSEIRVMAYDFTSTTITKALAAARHRGVNIMMVADAKNLETPYGKRALSALGTAGVMIRTVNQFPAFHDKVLIVDRMHLETGSFNFSNYAASRNSENVIVMWNSPDVVQPYMEHFNARWQLGVAFTPGY